jgi:predicted RNA-binding protein (virulence factor B family)
LKQHGMVKLGKTQRLRVVKEVPFGVYLDGHELGEVLLPKRYIPKGTRIGEQLEVFLYLDSEDLPIATTLRPKVQVGQCAHLRVVDLTPIGAFVDWGLPKDLLVPFRQQRVPMQQGRSYTVYCYLDEHTGRIVGSSRLADFLNETDAGEFQAGQPVDLLLCGRTDLGLKAVIDGTHLGMVLSNDLLQPIRVGQRVKGYIKGIREDGKINLALQPLGQPGRDALEERILAFLKAEGGSSTLTDRSSPETIYRRFGVSKANYKKALGRLYKARLIDLGKERIQLL